MVLVRYIFSDLFFGDIELLGRWILGGGSVAIAITNTIALWSIRVGVLQVDWI